MARVEKVRIVHPRTGAESEVTPTAFERRSSKLGWVLADAHPGEVRFASPLNPGPVDDRETLVEKARSLGLKVHPRAKPETIQRQIDKVMADL